MLGNNRVSSSWLPKTSWKGGSKSWRRPSGSMDLEESARESSREATAFGEFYLDKMENDMNGMSINFSDDVIFDWFGETTKGDVEAMGFIKRTLGSVRHVFTDFKPAKTIGSGDQHKFKVSRVPKLMSSFTLLSPPRIYNPKSDTKTPKKQIGPSTSRNLFNTLNDGAPNETPNRAPNTDDGESSEQPAKKQKTTMNGEPPEAIETVEGESDAAPSDVRYVVAEGAIEFHKPSLKKLQRVSRWRRPCKLSVAYSCSNFTDYTIYLIVYESNVKCKRNLLKDFEALDAEN